LDLPRGNSAEARSAAEPNTCEDSTSSSSVSRALDSILPHFLADHTFSVPSNSPTQRDTPHLVSPMVCCAAVTLPFRGATVNQARRAQIEAAARNLLRDMWRDHRNLFPMGKPKPVQVADPEAAARFLGMRLEYAEGLGRWTRGDANYEIAGLLDQQRSLIRVSTRFEYEVQRFTAAHEVGHVVLRHAGKVIHRDRPISEVRGAGKDPDEQEADYFAATFLAPSGLVNSEYQERFGLGPPLPLNDAVAFNLCAESAHALMRAGPDSLLFAARVASARQFNGRRFRGSLAEHFNISVKAMAIRLRELHLVED
jgi:hypothetical protein